MPGRVCGLTHTHNPVRADRLSSTRLPRHFLRARCPRDTFPVPDTTWVWSRVRWTRATCGTLPRHRIDTALSPHLAVTFHLGCMRYEAVPLRTRHPRSSSFARLLHLLSSSPPPLRTMSDLPEDRNASSTTPTPSPSPGSTGFPPRATRAESALTPGGVSVPEGYSYLDRGNGMVTSMRMNLPSPSSSTLTRQNTGCSVPRLRTQSAYTHLPPSPSLRRSSSPGSPGLPGLPGFPGPPSSPSSSFTTPSSAGTHPLRSISSSGVASPSSSTHFPLDRRPSGAFTAQDPRLASYVRPQPRHVSVQAAASGRTRRTSTNVRSFIQAYEQGGAPLSFPPQRRTSHSSVHSARSLESDTPSETASASPRGLSLSRPRPSPDKPVLSRVKSWSNLVTPRPAPCTGSVPPVPTPSSAVSTQGRSVSTRLPLRAIDPQKEQSFAEHESKGQKVAERSTESNATPSTAEPGASISQTEGSANSDLSTAPSSAATSLPSCEPSSSLASLPEREKTGNTPKLPGSSSASTPEEPGKQEHEQASAVSGDISSRDGDACGDEETFKLDDISSVVEEEKKLPSEIVERTEQDGMDRSETRKKFDLPISRKEAPARADVVLPAGGEKSRKQPELVGTSDAVAHQMPTEKIHDRSKGTSSLSLERKELKTLKPSSTVQPGEPKDGPKELETANATPSPGLLQEPSCPRETLSSAPTAALLSSSVGDQEQATVSPVKVTPRQETVALPLRKGQDRMTFLGPAGPEDGALNSDSCREASETVPGAWVCDSYHDTLPSDQGPRAPSPPVCTDESLRVLAGLGVALAGAAILHS